MNKEIDVNDFCVVHGIAADSDAELLYQYLESIDANDIIVVLNFADIKLVYLSFFETLFSYYFSNFNNLRLYNLRLCNLTKEQLPLVKEALLFVSSRR